MKKNIVMVLIVAILATSFTGCSQRKNIDGVTYDTYGLFTENKKANPNIEYELSVGNVIWGIILIETIIGPIYFFGFDLWEPVGPKVTNPNMKGVVSGTVPTQAPQKPQEQFNQTIYKGQ